MHRRDYLNFDRILLEVLSSLWIHNGQYIEACHEYVLNVSMFFWYVQYKASHSIYTDCKYETNRTFLSMQLDVSTMKWQFQYLGRSNKIRQSENIYIREFLNAINYPILLIMVFLLIPLIWESGNEPLRFQKYGKSSGRLVIPRLENGFSWIYMKK